MSSVTRHAHAKLNAFLRVLGPREDGFHDIQTAILPIELHDVVTIEEHDALVIEVTGERAEELEG
ncbi:MAG TPA: 4-(cytidine 5'-diphospho)-2-C-methyl-D-erythritol kinase, partial [Actinomycetota bacterium]|nr:4-(cytidine 5'-diphospho)-2-C-methyl-D-erythritol kinase [Actinomycetota bacterium]